jgi:hypothetical protein
MTATLPVPPTWAEVEAMVDATLGTAEAWRSEAPVDSFARMYVRYATVFPVHPATRAAQRALCRSYASGEVSPNTGDTPAARLRAVHVALVAGLVIVDPVAGTARWVGSTSSSTAAVCTTERRARRASPAFVAYVRSHLGLFAGTPAADAPALLHSIASLVELGDVSDDDESDGDASVTQVVAHDAPRGAREAREAREASMATAPREAPVAPTTTVPPVAATPAEREAATPTAHPGAASRKRSIVPSSSSNSSESEDEGGAGAPASESEAGDSSDVDTPSAKRARAEGTNASAPPAPPASAPPPREADVVLSDSESEGAPARRASMGAPARRGRGRPPGSGSRRTSAAAQAAAAAAAPVRCSLDVQRRAQRMAYSTPRAARTAWGMCDALRKLEGDATSVWRAEFTEISELAFALVQGSGAVRTVGDALVVGHGEHLAVYRTTEQRFMTDLTKFNALAIRVATRVSLAEEQQHSAAAARDVRNAHTVFTAAYGDVLQGLIAYE